MNFKDQLHTNIMKYVLNIYILKREKFFQTKRVTYITRGGVFLKVVYRENSSLCSVCQRVEAEGGDRVRTDWLLKVSHEMLDSGPPYSRTTSYTPSPGTNNIYN